MAPTKPWLMLLCLAAAFACSGVLQARAQPDSKGFISIDCGLPVDTSYVDDVTKLSYTSDAGFTDTGTNRYVSVEYMKPESLLSTRYLNVRSFPDGMRNCYTLRSLIAGLKYLIRANFFYGNYDGLDATPIVFHLHIGINFWTVVNVSTPGNAVQLEAIVLVPDDFVQVCLVNAGTGTPFISGLDLRPLKKSLYPQANATQGLVLTGRINFGAPDQFHIVRYPNDPYDRIWYPRVNTRDWTSISTPNRVGNVKEDLFEAPTAVMQTAITPQDAAKNIEFSWDPEPEPNDPTPGYTTIMHFSELQILPNNAVRLMNVIMNGKPWYTSDFTPRYLIAGILYNDIPMRYNYYNVSINAAANSTLRPIINALEIFSVISIANLSTNSQDVSAITAIKMKYQVKNNWMGDPCLPKNMSWDRLACGYNATNPLRITSVDLSLSGLAGDISSSFASLKAVQYLNLSNNNLLGSIPDDLSQLTSLKIIDLSGNRLSGSIPPGLLTRVQNGSLLLRYDNNPNLCMSDNSCQIAKEKMSKLAIYIVATGVVVVVVASMALLLFCLLRARKREGSMNSSVRPRNESLGDSSLRLENRRFTYDELGMITNGFERILGRGGFGYVYDGFLEDGTQVAVKLRSRSSSQGVSVFLVEAHILTRIHHKNLVSMIGYCKDGEDMALVYEYMSEGTLKEHITGENGKCLFWRQRLEIALESARGLEYLHKGCSPPLIHRDVKTSNILLNSRLEAKIADFGLSKALNHDNDTHVSTNTLVGTPGYVDPECLATMQPTVKSDVYSFGVVLLELVTGKPAILQESTPISIIEWVRHRLARGNIESVVDERMHGDYEVNGVWKVADIALKCTSHVSVQRPNITDVAAHLQESLELEDSRSSSNVKGAFYTGSGNDLSLSYDGYAAYQSTNVSQESASFEMEHDPKRMPRVTESPIAR